MSDLVDRLREAAAAGGANAALLTEAADWIVRLNGEHDAMCTERGTIVERALGVIALAKPAGVFDGAVDAEAWPAMAGAVDALEAVVLVQTSAPTSASP